MKIQNRLIVFITCIVAVVVIFSSYLSLNLFKRMVVNIEKENFASLLRVFAYSCKLDIDRFVTALGEDEEVLYAMVISTDGDVLVHSDKSMEGKNLKDPVSVAAIEANAPHFSDIVWEGQKGIDAAMPIKMEDVKWVIVRIGFSIQHLEKDVIRARNFILVLASLAMLIGITFAYLLSKKIVQPILKLTEKAEQIALGKRDVKFDFPVIREENCAEILKCDYSAIVEDDSYSDEPCWKIASSCVKEDHRPFEDRFSKCRQCRVFIKYMNNEVNRLIETFKIMYKSILQKENALKEDELKITRVNVVLQDALKRLLDSETKYKTLAESARDIIFTLDLSGRFDFVSGQADEMLELDSQKDMVGKSFTKILTRESRKAAFKKFKKLRAGEETKAFEVKALRGDDKFVTLELILSPIIEAEKLVGIHGIARNITYRKTLEAQLIQTGRLSSIGELATGIAHELNQPLMIIRGYSQLINSDLNEGDKHYRELRLLEKHTGRMAKIISHLQAFARQDAPFFSELDINEVIESSQIMVSEHLKVKNIEVTMNLSDGLPPIYGDTSQLEQVFINLITNARDALDALGGGVLEFTTALSDDAKSVIVKVIDTGAGIDVEHLENIFNPFFTTKDVGKGTGLGLSISYGIIQSHKGTITVESEVGKGTTFTITLPAHKDRT